MELLSAVFAYRMVHCLRPTACIINHIGIIRGSIQRVAVHVLAEPLESEQSATDVMDTIDSLIERFLAEQSNYKFKNKQQEGDLIRNMLAISEAWRDLRDTSIKYRSTHSEELRREIMDKSERCWNLADAAALAAQHVSEDALDAIDLVLVIIALGLLNTLIVVCVTYVYIRRRLEHHAAYDALTSVWNRRSYETEIETEVYRSRRYKRNMSLIVFDIDHFKSINDKYGHKTGDAVLATAANVAKQHIRQSDSLFRIGGDEFAVVVPEANTAQAYEVMEKIRQAIEQHSFAPVERVTISAGVSELGDDMNPADLFNQADNALYQAKQNGRNTTRWMQVAPDTCA